MVLSCPSFLAAVTRAFMPPQAATEEQVAQSVVLPDAELAAVDEPLELHPAASRIDPTAALAAAIAFDARKVRPSHAAPRGKGALAILARQVGILANHVEREVAGLLITAVRLVAICTH